MKKITIQKGQILQRKGELNTKGYQVESGLLRSYSIDEKGKEHIFMFAPENWLIADTCSPEVACDLFIDAIEDSSPAFLKLTNTNEELKIKGNGRMDWTLDISSTSLKLIGVVEVLAALGLILPLLLNIEPWLTPLAAVGVVLTMIGAIILHIRRGDKPATYIMNGVILLMAAFVAYGRYLGE